MAWLSEIAERLSFDSVLSHLWLDRSSMNGCEPESQRSNCSSWLVKSDLTASLNSFKAFF
jgi:hypothetical protein